MRVSVAGERWERVRVSGRQVCAGEWRRGGGGSVSRWRASQVWEHLLCLLNEQSGGGLPKKGKIGSTTPKPELKKVSEEHNTTTTETNSTQW